MSRLVLDHNKKHFATTSSPDYTQAVASKLELKVQNGKQKSALGKNGWPNQEVHDAMKNSWQPVEEESHSWEVY